MVKVYRGIAADEESPRMPERKRSERAKSLSRERRQARALKYAGAAR